MSLSGLLKHCLAACSQEKKPVEEKTLKTEQKAVKRRTVGSASQAPSIRKREKSNKKSYYSIQGGNTMRLS